MVADNSQEVSPTRNMGFSDQNQMKAGTDGAGGGSFILTQSLITNVHAWQSHALGLFGELVGDFPDNCLVVEGHRSIISYYILGDIQPRVDIALKNLMLSFAEGIDAVCNVV